MTWMKTLLHGSLLVFLLAGRSTGQSPCLRISGKTQTSIHAWKHLPHGIDSYRMFHHSIQVDAAVRLFNELSLQAGATQELSNDSLGFHSFKDGQQQLVLHYLAATIQPVGGWTLDAGILPNSMTAWMDKTISLDGVQVTYKTGDKNNSLEALLVQSNGLVKNNGLVKSQRHLDLSGLELRYKRAFGNDLSVSVRANYLSVKHRDSEGYDAVNILSSLSQGSVRVYAHYLHSLASSVRNDAIIFGGDYTCSLVGLRSIFTLEARHLEENSFDASIRPRYTPGFGFTQLFTRCTVQVAETQKCTVIHALTDSRSRYFRMSYSVSF